MPGQSLDETAATLAAMARARPSRVGVVVVAAVVALTCVALGFWQLRRFHDRRVDNAALERARAGDPLRIDSGAGGSGLRPYTPVDVTGSFDPEHEVLLYGHDLAGHPGSYVVTPLLLDDGTGVLVVRGWVPIEEQRAPVSDAPPPDGDLTVRGFLVPDEGDGSIVPNDDRVIRRLDVQGIRSTLPYPVLALAMQLTAQGRPQPSELPIPLGWPELSEGPHLSYAIQWFSFATIAVVGGVILIRRRSSGATAGP